MRHLMTAVLSVIFVAGTALGQTGTQSGPGAAASAAASATPDTPPSAVDPAERRSHMPLCFWSLDSSWLDSGLIVLQGVPFVQRIRTTSACE